MRPPRFGCAAFTRAVKSTPFPKNAHRKVSFFFFFFFMTSIARETDRMEPIKVANTTLRMMLVVLFFLLLYVTV